MKVVVAPVQFRFFVENLLQPRKIIGSETDIPIPPPQSFVACKT